MAAFHAGNAAAYSLIPTGDTEVFRSSGGSQAAWTVPLAVSSAHVSYMLARDSALVKWSVENLGMRIGHRFSNTKSPDPL